VGTSTLKAEVRPAETSGGPGRAQDVAERAGRWPRCPGQLHREQARDERAPGIGPRPSGRKWL